MVEADSRDDLDAANSDAAAGAFAAGYSRQGIRGRVFVAEVFIFPARARNSKGAVMTVDGGNLTAMMR